MQTREKNSFIK